MTKPFLFTLSRRDRHDLFEAAAIATGLPHFVLDKDYYVTLTLKLLFERLKPQHTETIPTPFIFKGGTTLSEVYGCIDRMSEDIDLSLDMNFLGYPEPADNEGTTTTGRRVTLLNKATPDSSRLMPEAELARFLEEDWENMDVMFPGSLPWSFGEMLEKLAAINERINKLNVDE